jgi:NDP-sugar pyrophosphorylase family protein
VNGSEQAVILAGGEGTRLRPLTLSRAKPVVPLLNRPLLAYQLALLQRHGVADVILACSYRVDDVRAALGDGTALGTHLRYVVEDVPRGTGGGVRNAADLARGIVFVLNGDVLTDVDLTAMRRFHDARGSRVTIFLRTVEDPRPYGLVECDGDGRIRAFREKPESLDGITARTINGGVYLIDAALLARIPADRAVSIEREFFPAVVADGTPCFGWIAEPYWRDIGAPAAYREAQVDLLEGRVTSPLPPPGDAKDGSWLADGVRVGRDARVEAPSVIGSGVELGDGAIVGPHAVLGARCRIGAGARVRGAVLWDDVTVGAGAILRDCVVASGARIGAHAEVGPGVTLAAGAIVGDGARAC